MTIDIKNSSGKITGQTIINYNDIIIDNDNKPKFIITDSDIIKEIHDNIISNKTLIVLYNEYTLTVGEIASLYNRCYSNLRRILKTIPEIKFNNRGRRNRAFGHPVSKEQSEKMSKALKGRKPSHYERTPEIKQKISKSLKEYYKLNPQDPKPHIENWKNGVYDNVDFKIGISGHFHSIKINMDIRFRSLLELYYLLQLENDTSVVTYQYEPFHINMDNGKSYMPDFLVNNKYVIELKSKKYINNVSGVLEKVEYKKSQAINYCNANNFIYQIIYDEEIGFDSKRMKHYINDNPDVVKKYCITFTDPNRMVTK